MRRAPVPLLGLAALPTPFAAVALVCWWLVLIPVAPGRTRVRQAAAASVLAYACNAMLLTLLAVMNAPCNPHLLLGALLTGGLAVRLTQPEPAPKPFADATDSWALALGAVTFATLAAPLLGASLGKSMALISQTTDGATHVGIVRAIAQHRGYVQFHRPGGMSPGAQHYPSAWHGNVWITSDLLLGSHASVSSLVRLVDVTAFAGYSLLSALAASLALRLRSRQDRHPRLSALVVILVVGLSTLVGFGLYFVQLSSYTQVSALVALLVLTSAVLDEAAGVSVLLLVAASATALMQSWYLLAPLAVAPSLIALQRARPSRRLLVALASLTALLGSFPVLTGPHSTQLDEPGATLLPTIGGVLGLLVATAGGCVVALRASRPPLRDGVRAVVGSVVASLLTMVLLVAKQGFVSGSGVTYYGAKVLLATFLLGAVLAAAAAPAVLTGVRSNESAIALTCLVGVAVCTWSTARWTIPPRTAVQFGNLHAATLDAIYERHPHGLPAATEVWVADGCDRVADEITSKWPYDTGLAWNDDIRRALDEYANSRPGDVSMIQARLQDPHLQTLEVYLHHECDRPLVSTLLHNPKTDVIRVP